jgi:hypothetical protein
MNAERRETIVELLLDALAGDSGYDIRGYLRPILVRRLRALEPHAVYRRIR